MTNMAVHLRISGLQVTDADVNSRNAAVSALATRWNKGKRKPVEVAKQAAEIALALGSEGVTPPTALSADVEVAVQEHASAFLASERPLEVGICAGLAALTVIERPSANGEGWGTADLLATCLWSALGFQPTLQEPKREALRLQLLNAARKRAIASAEAARQRSPVPEVPEISPAEGEESTALLTLRKGIVSSITALRRNAALDREELDFLWWSQLQRSTILDRPLKELNEFVRLVALGVEAAGYLRRLPCEVHRDLVLRGAQEGSLLDLSEVVALFGEERGTVADRFSAGAATDVPAVFPLVAALVQGESDVDGASTKRSSSEWGARALLEAGLLEMIVSGPATS